jgi:hypothetical protein
MILRESTSKGRQTKAIKMTGRHVVQYSRAFAPSTFHQRNSRRKRERYGHSSSLIQSLPPFFTGSGGGQRGEGDEVKTQFLVFTSSPRLKAHKDIMARLMMS